MTDKAFLLALLPLLSPGQLILALNRTNWMHGTQPLNLLVLGVVLNGFTLLLVWTALPHGGSSDTARREQLVARLLRHFPACRWKVLVADREFVGQDWFRFLRRRHVKRCLRVEGSAHVDGDRLDEVYANLGSGQTVAMLGKEVVYGCRMQIVVTRSPSGDLVCLATDLHAQDACWIYRFRWSVQCTFSSMKLRVVWPSFLNKADWRLDSR